MSQFHRFFFVFSLTFFLPIIFIFGITFYPIGLCVKKLFRCCGTPAPPERPQPPKKPEKPVEPNVGASKEEWSNYRKDMESYRSSKKTWKIAVDEFDKNKNKIMDEYYKRRKTYMKKYGDDYQEVTFGSKMINATEYMLFFRTGNSALMAWFVADYEE